MGPWTGHLFSPTAPFPPSLLLPRKTWRKRTNSYSSLLLFLLNKIWPITSTQKVFESMNEWVNKWSEWMALSLEGGIVSEFPILIYNRRNTTQVGWRHEWIKCFKPWVVFSDSTWPFALSGSSAQNFLPLTHSDPQLKYPLLRDVIPDQPIWGYNPTSSTSVCFITSPCSFSFLALFSMCSYFIYLWSPPLPQPTIQTPWKQSGVYLVHCGIPMRTSGTM